MFPQTSNPTNIDSHKHRSHKRRSYKGRFNKRRSPQISDNKIIRHNTHRTYKRANVRSTNVRPAQTSEVNTLVQYICRISTNVKSVQMPE